MFSRVHGLQYKYHVVLVYMFGLMMNQLDSTALNVAIPRLQTQFHASLSTVEWTVSGYLLSLALVIPGAGFISDRFGTKRSYLGAVVLFTGGSLLCGLAPNIQTLIALRFLQGIGGGMMTPVGAALISREFPGEERAKASAWVTGPVVLAPILGPVLGGWFVEFASWRWIFFINLPVGIFVIFLSATLLREHREPYAQGSFDITGLALGGVGTAALLFGLSNAANGSWDSPDVVIWALLGIALLVAFCLLELRVSTPVLDLRLFKEKYFAISNIMIMGSFAAQSGYLFLLTLFLQQLQGRSPVHAGLTQAPSAVGTALALPLAPLVYGRVGPRKLITAGFGASTLLMIPFVRIDIATGTGIIVLLIAVRGIPSVFANVSVQTVVYGPLDSSKQGPAASIYSTSRQVAGAVGVALAATVSQSRYNSHLRDALHGAPIAGATKAVRTHATLLAFHDAYFVLAGLLLFSTVMALFINDADIKRLMLRRTIRIDGQKHEPGPAFEAAGALAE